MLDSNLLFLDLLRSQKIWVSYFVSASSATYNGYFAKHNGMKRHFLHNITVKAAWYNGEQSSKMIESLSRDLGQLFCL
jgi:hypothetical protein